MLSPGWHIGALCSETDPEIFFPAGGSTFKVAKRICNSCPVMEDCLQASLDGQEEFGVWGGTSSDERLGLLREIHGQNYQWPAYTPIRGMEGATKGSTAGHTMCRQGHLFEGDNVWTSPKGTERRCRECRTVSRKRAKDRKRWAS